jgi:hypothetical protein
MSMYDVGWGHQINSINEFMTDNYQPGNSFDFERDENP